MKLIFNMGYSVQIINVKNKDKVLNESKMQFNYNTTKIHDNNYYINKSMLYGIRFAIVSTVVLVSAILLR